MTDPDDIERIRRHCEGADSRDDRSTLLAEIDRLRAEVERLRAAEEYIFLRDKAVAAACADLVALHKQLNHERERREAAEMLLYEMRGYWQEQGDPSFVPEGQLVTQEANWTVMRIDLALRALRGEERR